VAGAFYSKAQQSAYTWVVHVCI